MAQRRSYDDDPTDLRIDRMIGACIAALVGILIIAYAVVPIAYEAIDTLMQDHADIATLLGLVITFLCIGLIVGVVRMTSMRR